MSPRILGKSATPMSALGDILRFRGAPAMNASPTYYDVSAAGSLAASVCAREAREPPNAAPPPFAATPRPPCPAPLAAKCSKAGWRRLFAALFDLVSGPRL